MAILPGEVAALDSATLASIVDGTYTPMATTEASGEVSIDASSLTEGTYTVVVVPIAGKEAQEDGITYKTFKYTLSGAELFDEVAAGTLTLGAADISSIVSSDGSSWGTLLTALGSDTPSMTQEAVLSKSRTDETHYKLSPFWQDGYDLDFHVDNEGYITVAGIDTGIGGSDGNVMAYDFSNVFKRYTLAQLNQIGIASTLNGDTYTFNLYYKDNSYAYAAETETFEVTATGAKSLKAAKRGGVKLIGKTLNNNARFLKSFNGKILSAGNLKGHHLR